MSFKHGKDAAFYLGAIDLSTYGTAVDLAVDVDTADSTTFHATWKRMETGTIASKVDFAGLYDPALASLPALLTSAVPGVLTYCPAGYAAIGDAARLAAPFEASYSESVPVGGVVALKAAFAGAGVLGYGVLLHPLAEDTNTTTGATRHDAAATTTGWTANLHVTAVDAGSWVVKLQDSPDGSAWSDVTGGAFTAATGATSQQLVGAAAAALDEYVRYVATRTGGAGGDGVTFLLAYARN